LLSFQYWIIASKGKFYKVENFWLNMRMTSSKYMVNRFHDFVIMKVNVEKQCLSSTKPIICTIASSTNLIYFGILIFKIWEKVKVLQNLVIRFTSKGFYIANLTLFVMLYTKIDLWRSRVAVENKLGTQISSSLTFLG